MKTFKHEFDINCNIEKVWNFYINVKHLEIITPKNIHLKILKTTDFILSQNSEIWLSGKMIIQSNWHSKITCLKPYEYVDEMLSGRFKTWKHSHKFQVIDEHKTKVLDKIEFELPYGLLGQIFERFAICKLQQIFTYRKNATINALQ